MAEWAINLRTKDGELLPPFLKSSTSKGKNAEGRQSVTKDNKKNSVDNSHFWVFTKKPITFPLSKIKRLFPFVIRACYNKILEQQLF